MSAKPALHHRMLMIGVASVAGLAAFTGVAFAASAIDPSDSSVDIAKSVYAAIAGGHYALAVASALVVGVALIRKYWDSAWMHTDAGSASLVLAGSFGTALVASLAGGGPLTAHLAWSAFVVAFAASGGYAAIKKIVVEPLAPSLPPWLYAAVSLVFALAPQLPPATVVTSTTTTTVTPPIPVTPAPAAPSDEHVA